jgi:katanin p60 ATPase-containing subunit A1
MVERLKAEGNSRMAEQKRVDERKKNLLVLVYRHLLNCGYADAAANLDRECNIELGKWEAADNIDLPVILQEYEAFFEMRFLKKPVLVRKSTEDDIVARRKPGLLPKIQTN